MARIRSVDAAVWLDNSFFARHHGKPFASFACPCRFDGGVERQEARPRRDRLDLRQDSPDGFGFAAQTFHDLGRGAHLVAGAPRHDDLFLTSSGNSRQRFRDVVGRRRQHADARRDVLQGSRNSRQVVGCLAGRLQHRRGGRFHDGQLFRHALGKIRQVGGGRDQGFGPARQRIDQRAKPLHQDVEIARDRHEVVVAFRLDAPSDPGPFAGKLTQFVAQYFNGPHGLLHETKQRQGAQQHDNNCRGERLPRTARDREDG